MAANILHQIIDHKRREIERRKTDFPMAGLTAKIKSAPGVRDFVGALQQARDVALIAEVKKASPSQGVIRVDFDPAKIAMIYQENGASCVSVLTDEEFFQGHLDFLSQIRSGCELPLLRKDFVVDEYQVVEARVAGADAVLLIAECLDSSTLRRLHDKIVELGMTPLVEFYREENLGDVLDCNPRLVGINNRNLETFDVSIEHAIKLRKSIPTSITVVAESGIFTHEHLLQMKKGNIQAILVGQALMEPTDIGLAVRKLLGKQ